jgi:hypothetical protein
MNNANNAPVVFWTVTEYETCGSPNEAVSPWGEAFRTKQGAIDAVTDALIALWECDDEGGWTTCSKEEACVLDFEQTISETRIVAYSEVFDRWFLIVETKLG